jgi:hypothetical protein
MAISETDKNWIYALTQPGDDATDEVLEGYARIVLYLEQVMPG